MKNEVVVITGASAGVGRATAQAFAKQGASIGLIARDIDRLEQTQKEIEELGGKALILSMDVSDAFQMERAANKVEEQLGPIDIWINNAMTSVFSPTIEMTSEEYKRVTEVTYLGYVYGTLAALKKMLPRDRGVIIQVGSGLAYRSIPLQSAYCGAKHAVKGFTDSVRCELMHDGSGVKITMVQLPAINTPQFDWVKSRLPRKAQPIPPIYQPEVAAEAIVWAAYHYRREWYVGFSSTLAIIGNKIAPRLADWYLAKKGYNAQQYNGTADPNRPNNLFEPVVGDYSAHGDFDPRASRFSLHLWLNQRRTWLILGAIIFIAVVYGYFR